MGNNDIVWINDKLHHEKNYTIAFFVLDTWLWLSENIVDNCRRLYKMGMQDYFSLQVRGHDFELGPLGLLEICKRSKIISVPIGLVS